MRKTLLFIFALSAISFSQSSKTISNSNSWLDTALIWVKGTGTVYYSSLFNLTDMENLRAIAGANDSSSLGYGSDSIKVQWGYQTGSVCLNGSAAVDTAWDNRIVIDTLDKSKTNPAVGYCDSAGGLFRGYGQSDTLNLSGFMYQSRNFSPEWDQYLRFWVNGLTGNKTASAVKWVVNLKRRLFSNVRSK